MQGLALYRVEDYQLRIRGAADGLLDLSDPFLTMAFVGPNRKPIRITSDLKIFAWRIKRHTFVDGYAPPISVSTCLTPGFQVSPKGLIRTDQADAMFAQLKKLGAGPYMIEIEAQEFATDLKLRDALEIDLY